MKQKNVHLILQGKGGVGKSFIATLLAQFLRKKGRALECVDTDPVNATFSTFQDLKVRQIEVMTGDEIDPRKFDELVGLIAAAKTDVVIDNGASTFVPLCHYLLSNQVPDLLSTMGCQVIVHTVVTGGQSLLDTINGFAQLIGQFPKSVKFVVWLNPYWGRVEAQEKTFEEMRAYIDNKDRITALVHIPDWKADTFGRDLAQMLQQRQTFDEAIASEDTHIMVRQRLTMIQKAAYEEMEGAEVWG